MSLKFKNAERFVLYPGLLLAIALAAGARLEPSRALAGASGAADPVRIATVDILGITERMVLSDKYKSARETNTAALQKTLDPVVAQLRELQSKALSLAEGTPDR